MRGIPNWRGSSGNWLALILGFALLMGAVATFMFSSPAIQTVTFYSTSVLSYSGCNTNLTGCIIGVTSYATSTSTTTVPAASHADCEPVHVDYLARCRSHLLGGRFSFKEPLRVRGAIGCVSKPYMSAHCFRRL